MPPTFASDADLHALVDGQMDADRRTQTLRHLAGTPADRVRVESWQAQNELLQRAFAGVDLEPLPILLDLKAKPKLQCVPANDTIRPLEPAASRTSRRTIFVGLLLATTIAGAGSAAHYLNWTDTAVEDGSVGATEVALSDRASVTAAVASATSKQTLPTSHIPDLQPLGFAFVGATTIQEEPKSIQFTYKGGDESIVVSVAKAASRAGASDRSTAPQHVGEAFVWRRGDLVFALSGSPRPARLRAVAMAMQNRDDL